MVSRDSLDLRSWFQLIQVIIAEHHFIFTNRFGNPHNPAAVNRAIKRIVDAHNAEEEIKAKKQKREPVILPRFSCHIFRHTFASRFCENETNVKVIQEVMGHADVSTTMNIYAEDGDIIGLNQKTLMRFYRLSPIFLLPYLPNPKYSYPRKENADGEDHRSYE